jgi:hypothetical protein
MTAFSDGWNKSNANYEANNQKVRLEKDPLSIDGKDYKITRQ